MPSRTSTLRPYPSLLTRIHYTIRVFFFKLVVSLYIRFAPHLQDLKDLQPTYRKEYAPLPGYQNNVFIPKTWKAGDKPLPLLIDVHGGGFTIGHPNINSRDNVILSSYGICIVSINYRKAPEHPFPTPVHDVAAMIEAVLDDDTLPVDKSRVALLGYSAGANLALTASQLRGIHKRIKGVVAYYPACDVGRGVGVRAKTSVKLPEGRGDILMGMAPMFDWAYVPKNTDRHQPLLSPLNAPRNTIPEKVFIMGCEYDMLCREAEETAEAWATAEGAFEKRKELGGGRVGWSAGNVTWEKLLKLEHGFNQRGPQEKDEEVKKFWEKRTKECHEVVAEWLFKEVYDG